MVVTYPMFLSVTEPNNEVGTIKIRQFDEGTQVFDVTITENNKLKNLTGLTPFFCVKNGNHVGLGISEQIVTDITDAKNGKLRYTLTNYDMQQLGERTAYFSFRRKVDKFKWREQFSTKDFKYTVIQSIYQDGIKDSNYIWTFEEILRYFTEWVKTCQDVYDDWYIKAQEQLQKIIKEFQAWISSNQDIYDDWLEESKETFLKWFESIKNILNENVAGNLLSMIQKLEKNFAESIKKLKESQFTIKDKEVSVLITLQDDSFSKNFTVEKIETVADKKEFSALVIAEINNAKQDTFYLEKVGEINV